ncbi:hypothetical protein IMZ48_08845, partial [Candidatus Bathyarchaeota archaeon]|nr:hypothetical protein [Candidatus Bathyarchaeota archaeon]
MDKTSLAYAQQNIARNNLTHRIRLAPRAPASALLPLDDLDLPAASFAMTNPPFYESAAELA